MKQLAIGFIAVLFFSCQKNPDSPEGIRGKEGYGNLYFGSGNAVYAYDLEKEAVKWIAPAFLIGNNAMLYEEGIIYTGSVYGVTAVDATSGSVKWTTGFIRGGSYGQSNFDPSNRPVLKDSLIYMIGYNESGENATLYCLDKKSGASKWEQDLTEGLNSQEWVYTTPVIAGDKIIALNHGFPDWNRIHCIDRFTGENYWMDDFAGDDYLNGYPIALDEKTVLFGSRSSTLYKLDVATRQITVLMNTGPERLRGNKKLLHQDVKLYVGTDGGIKNIHPGTGQVVQFFPDDINDYLITPTSMYIHKQYGLIQGKDLNSYSTKWSWTSPMQQVMDTGSYDTRFFYNYAHNSFLISDDQMVYYYEFMPGGGGTPLFMHFT